MRVTIRHGHSYAFDVVMADADDTYTDKLFRTKAAMFVCCALDERDSERNDGSVDNVLILFFGHFFSSTKIYFCVGEVTL